MESGLAPTLEFHEPKRRPGNKYTGQSGGFGQRNLASTQPELLTRRSGLKPPDLTIFRAELASLVAAHCRGRKYTECCTAIQVLFAFLF